MAAVAEVLSTVTRNAGPRGCDLPTCPVCADSMVAAEASAYLSDNVISYLWTCDTCGYGFVTKHSRQAVCLQLSLLVFQRHFSAARCRPSPSRRACVRENFRTFPLKSRP